MSFFEGFYIAITNSFNGIGIIFEKGIWPYIFYPFVLRLILWCFSIWVFAESSKLYYNFERHNMSISQRIHFTRKNKGIVCDIAVINYFSMLFPSLIGMLFAPIITIVGAAICFLQIKNENIPFKI